MRPDDPAYSVCDYRAEEDYRGHLKKHRKTALLYDTIRPGEKGDHGERNARATYTTNRIIANMLHAAKKESETDDV